MDAAVEAAVADAHRREWAFVLAATMRVAGDLDLAEDCVQDAYAKALNTWPISGIPTRPGAWLTTVARRRAIDLMRRSAIHERLLPELALSIEPGEHVATSEIEDDRLRLIFICCHPALAQESQIALTLRLVCGLTTSEIARLFLVQDTTMAARLTRAKKKITAATIPFRFPDAAQLPDRIDAVLSVVHLLFTTGHTAPSGTELVREDLVGRALHLARMLRSLIPGNPDVAGLLALILLTDARRDSRVSKDGSLALLQDQDRSSWKAEEIAEGIGLVREALQGRPPGRFALMAAIAAVHAEAPTWEATDWAELVGLYDVLSVIWPSPVVALNRAVALGLAMGPAAGLEALDTLAGDPQLNRYGYLASSRGGFLLQLNRFDEARLAYETALTLTSNEVERRFLLDRLAVTRSQAGVSSVQLQGEGASGRVLEDQDGIDGDVTSDDPRCDLDATSRSEVI